MAENINLQNYNYTVIHRWTKKGQNLIDNYERGLRQKKTSLSQCYGHCSQFKQRAFNYCEKMCLDLNGYNLVITSYNCTAFCVAFMVPSWNALFYITKDYNYCILL